MRQLPHDAVYLICFDLRYGSAKNALSERPFSRVPPALKISFMRFMVAMSCGSNVTPVNIVPEVGVGLRVIGPQVGGLLQDFRDLFPVLAAELQRLAHATMNLTTHRDSSRGSRYAPMAMPMKGRRRGFGHFFPLVEEVAEAAQFDFIHLRNVVERIAATSMSFWIRNCASRGSVLGRRVVAGLSP